MFRRWFGKRCLLRAAAVVAAVPPAANAEGAKFPKTQAAASSVAMPTPIAAPAVPVSAGAAADLSLNVHSAGLPQPGCFEPDDEVLITVDLGPTAVNVVGGQFLILYDPMCLRAESILPGQSCDDASPFVHSLFLTLDEAAGRLVYAVTSAFNGPGAPGPATLACLRFRKLLACAPCVACFDSQNPANTVISDAAGHPVQVVPHCSEPIRTATEIVAECPSDQDVRARCNPPTALVTWAPPEIADDCQDPLALSCTAVHSGGANLVSRIPAGGTIPLGVSTFCCSAMNACGVFEECCWTVTVTEAEDADCADDDPCTVDTCEPSSPQAGIDGCVHRRLIILACDVAPPPGDGEVDVADALCIMNGFADPGLCPLGDVSPCEGDGAIDVSDLITLLDAFAGDFACAHPCPP